jgi:hypothetical protein
MEAAEYKINKNPKIELEELAINMSKIYNCNSTCLFPD